MNLQLKAKVMVASFLLLTAGLANSSQPAVQATADATPAAAFVKVSSLTTVPAAAAGSVRVAARVAEPGRADRVSIREASSSSDIAGVEVGTRTLVAGLPIPEPGGWAVVIAGMLGVGAIARRRMNG